MRTIVTTLLIQAVFCGIVVANSNLESGEVTQILEILTSQPKKTWISSGIILANHEEYKAPAKIVKADEIDNRISQQLETYHAKPNKIQRSEKLQRMKLEAIPFNTRYELLNEYIMNTTETVRYDGKRFYWEIIADSRVDSIQPTAELADNYYARKFDMARNKIRTFAWDGKKYTKYYKPGNMAIITDEPSGVNGPLTAGVIPWGYGRYSYENLLNAEVSATAIESEDGLEIHLIIINNDNHEIFILDPAKDYAVKSYNLTIENASMSVHNYSNYQLVGENWCPGNIIIEEYDITTQPARLIAQDIWNFTSISNDTLTADNFNVEYEYDALIEDYSLGGKPLQYRFAPPQDPSVRENEAEKLLQSRLEILSSTDLSQNQNCATISLKYVCDKLGYNASWEDLSRLVKGREKSTNMLEMKKYVDGFGIEAVAIQTDLTTLKNINGCEVIIHLPHQNHYVVLGNIDDKYVRLIDLDKDKFLYRNSIEHFNKIWDGTALLINNKPITTKNQFAKINNNQLKNIIGAADCESCDNLYQEYRNSDCVNGDDCRSQHTIEYERYTCQSSSSGSCEEDDYIGSEQITCSPKTCTETGYWEASWIDACS